MQKLKSKSSRSRTQRYHACSDGSTAIRLPTTAGQGATGGLFGGLNNQVALAGLTAGGDGSLEQLRVSVDTRTNSIIVSGSASDLEVIEVLLMRL